LVNDDDVITGVDYTSGKNTKTNTSFIKDSKNELPVVIYEQEAGQLRVRKKGEYIRLSSSVSKQADNPIGVTEGGNIVYVTTSGYVYEIKNVEYLTEIKSTTPTRLFGRIVDLNIEDGTAIEYVYSNGKTEEIE